MNRAKSIRINENGTADIEFEDGTETIRCDKLESKELSDLTAVLDRLIMRAVHRRQSSGLTLDDYFKPINLE